MDISESSSISVLLVEGDPAFASTISTILRADGRNQPGDIDPLVRVGSIDHVDSLEAATEHLTTASYDVVLLDLDLPDSTGITPVDEIASGTAETPIIVLTDRYDQETGIEAIRRGAHDFLRKDHAEPALIKRTIRFALVRSRTQHQLAEYVQQLSFLDDVLRRGVRNELGAIIGHEPDLRELAEAHPAIEDVLGSAHAILRMIDAAGSSSRALLDDELETSVGSIEDILTESIDDVSDAYEFDLEFSSPSEQPPAVVCSPMLVMAVTEVLRNAIVHCYDDDPVVRIGVTATEDAVTVTVADNGPGMAPERRRMLSDPDRRFDQQAGMGVGLFLVTTVMDHLDGTFDVEGNERGGTTVRLTLPRAGG